MKFSGMRRIVFNIYKELFISASLLNLNRYGGMLYLKAEKHFWSNALYAFTICLFLFCILFPGNPAAVEACSACESYYPWMHQLPGEDELESATADFFERYLAELDSEMSETVSTIEVWYLEIIYPGVEEIYDVYEVILCFKVELNEGGKSWAEYRYTVLQYTTEKGYHFNLYLTGFFDSKAELEAYLETYVIRLPLSSERVRLTERTAQVFDAGGYNGSRSNMPRFILFFSVLLVPALAFLYIKSGARKSRDS